MPGNQNDQWDEIFDVAVVGSGGGALTAALLAAADGATVVVVEKDELIGGTTAVSGGDMWIPNNRFIADSDSREDAIAYITRLSDGRAADPSLIEVYVDTAPEAFEYLLANTGYRSEPHIGLDDYYKGGGLIAPLLEALVDRGVEVRTSTPASQLVTDGAGVVAAPLAYARDRPE